MFKKGRFSGLVMLGKWWGNISKLQISYVIFCHTLSGNITPNFARGVQSHIIGTSSY